MNLLLALLKNIKRARNFAPQFGHRYKSSLIRLNTKSSLSCQLYKVFTMFQHYLQFKLSTQSCVLS